MTTRTQASVEEHERKSAERFCRVCLGARRVLHAPRSQISRIPLLQRQQAPAHHEQVGQRSAGLQSMQVLRQAAIAHLLKAKDPLDHADRVLDLRTHLGLVAILRLDRLVHPLAKAIATIGAVPGAYFAHAGHRFHAMPVAVFTACRSVSKAGR